MKDRVRRMRERLRKRDGMTQTMDVGKKNWTKHGCHCPWGHIYLRWHGYIHTLQKLMYSKVKVLKIRLSSFTSYIYNLCVHSRK